jgi:hypothetical protein
MSGIFLFGNISLSKHKTTDQRTNSKFTKLMHLPAQHFPNYRIEGRA